ncbi:MAG: DUF2752 domain-containing protein, partial [Chthoniobacterales bacterium]
MSSSSGVPLTLSAKRGRIVYLAVLALGLLALRTVSPGSLPHWLPFATSCGAVTGLPCIFCGTTRAVHYLLLGDYGRALYFNWLAYPLVAGAFALATTSLFELLLARNVLALIPRPSLHRRSLGGVAAALLILWCFQVYLAVSQHKTELLNP